jgi:hypothetical protein
MRKVKDYVILESRVNVSDVSCTGSLASEVMEFALKYGMEPLGAPFVVADMFVCQAMVTYATEAGE